MQTHSSLSTSTWWREHLRDVPHVTLPGRLDGDPETSAERDFEVPPALRRHLQGRGDADRMALLCAAGALVLARYGGGLDVIVADASLLVRITLDDGATGHEAVAAAAQARRDALAHPAPRSVLVDAAGAVPSLSVAWTEDSSDPPLAEVALEIGPTQGRLRYAAGSYEEAALERLAGHFCELLRGLIETPAARVVSLPMLTDDERQRLDAWNRTEVRLDGRCTPAMIAGLPSSDAVACGDDRLTYAHLRARAGALAARLHELGCTRGDRVAVCLERSVEMPLALLAVLQAGAAYVPLDPTLPAARLAMMLEDAGVRAVVTRRALAARLPSAPHLYLDDPLSTAATVSVDPEGDDSAYVIFTSGSTGRPKGVELHHRGLANLLTAMQAVLGLSPSDRMVAVTTLCFDIATMDMFLPLCAGATLVIARQEEVTDGLRLRDLLVRAGATVMQATPATWRMLIAAGWDGSPHFTAISGGEPLPPDLAALLLARCGRLFNMYGPTETTIYSTVSRVTDPQEIRIGRPIANTSAHVLDAHGQPVPIGVSGELYLGGTGVARGYLGRPDLTAERFLQTPHGRLYRTGDVVRWQDDGQLHCLGRADHQLKLRGYRIEPGEIEAALRACDDVDDAVVAAPPCDGEPRLVAWVAHAGTPPTRASLLARLRTVLPAYMLPSAFVMLDRLPRLANGKLDRASLPPPETPTGRQAEHVAPPRTPTETVLAMLFEDALGGGPVGVTDDFFELGGTSIQASSLFVQIGNRLGHRLHPTELLTAPTVEALARRLDRDARADLTRSLVALQPTGGRAPLFCMHAGAGTVLFYHALARRLGHDRPAYALQAPGLYGGPRRPADSVRDAAAAFIEEIRQVQPHGPYHLVGFCFGALTAFETARQLRARGERVGLVALLDGPAPPPPPRETAARPRGGLLQRVRRKLGPLTWRDRLRFVREAVRWRLVGFPAQYRLGRILSRLGFGVPQALRPRWFLFHHLVLERRFRPQRYDGHVVVLSTAGLFEDDALGWARLCGSLETHVVTHDHRSHRDLLEEPAVAAVADILRGHLDAADAPGGVAV